MELSCFYLFYIMRNLCGEDYYVNGKQTCSDIKYDGMMGVSDSMSASGFFFSFQSTI